MNEFMKVAKDLSEENLSTNAGGPFGACIVKDGKIIGKGNNHVIKNNDPTAHAEIEAIRDACKNINSYDLTGCELYTSCYPCPMCLSAIIWSNIKTIYYGNNKEDAEDIGFRDNMIYELFIAKKPAVLNLTACQEARKNAGLNPMTGSEAQALLDKMVADTNSWTPFVNADGEDDTIITKYSQAKQTRQVLAEVAAAMPDDSDVIDCYNALAEVYTECTKRKYNASTTYIIISAILMVGLAIMSGAYEAIAYCGVSVLLYIMASMTPNYILIRKELKGSRGPKFMSGFIAGILTGVATAETVTTVTKWSDGSTTKDVDNSNFWISLLFCFFSFH